jgi:phenylpropionate dioxygenase-like ring-hydroxylating dioxygenase large terminal subunit
VPPGKPARVVCGDSDFVLFRDAEGACHALSNRCAHRRAPLSSGRLTEQFFVECPYHGWRYNSTGACVAIPNLRPEEKIPKNYRVQAFETFERDGFIQILLGSGDGVVEPNSVDTPALDHRCQGQEFLAYPEDLFIETLIDCPSSILSISGTELLDDHPFGDPVVADGHVTIEYAATARRHNHRPLKHVVADFAYAVRICASPSMARIDVHSNVSAQLCATALIVSVPDGRRVTHVMWRGSASANSGAPMTIGCLDRIDAVPVRASNNVVSRVWAPILTPRMVD